jgi:hypothetical protein
MSLKKLSPPTIFTSVDREFHYYSSFSLIPTAHAINSFVFHAGIA